MEIVNNKICKSKPKDVKNGKVIIPYGIKAISSHAFWKNYNLKEITIPNNILSIGTGAFQDCNNLKQLCLIKEHNKFTYIRVYLKILEWKRLNFQLIFCTNCHLICLLTA